MDVEVVNWRSVVAPPGISPEQRKTLADAVEKTVKSKEWTELLKAKGWEDYYHPSDQFGAFLKAEQERVGDVLKTIGLVKS